MDWIFCEICQNEVRDCAHLQMERRELREGPQPRIGVKQTKSYKPRHNPVREYIDALNEAYRRPGSFAEFLRRDDGWVGCSCGIRHEPPFCCEPGESLDDL